jgi:mannitol/fructose-specific phosphotransferase system IIA component (Ntr-type)
MHELIKEKHIQISHRFDNWQKAIEFAAKPLLDDGVIQPRYITKMIWAVESLGPYMVILPKIAFVHAGNEDGVIRNGISCLRMAQPLSFGSQKATDVQVIFVIASKAKEDMGLLKLVRIIENMDNYDRLINANDIKAILALEG